MTTEEKQLLLVDLCARLTYRPNGVKLNAWFGPEDRTVIGYTGRFVETFEDEIEVENVRLYLRPMSSMTSQEWCELCDCEAEDEKAAIFIKDGRRFVSHVNQEAFLNSHHFDYRGLIPMGLALEAPEWMYKTESL